MHPLILWMGACIAGMLGYAHYSPKPEKEKETTVMVLCCVMIAGLYVGGAWMFMRGAVYSSDIQVLDVIHRPDRYGRELTIVYTDGDGKFIFFGFHDFQPGEACSIRWRVPNTWYSWSSGTRYRVDLLEKTPL